MILKRLPEIDFFFKFIYLKYCKSRLHSLDLGSDWEKEVNIPIRQAM